MLQLEICKFLAGDLVIRQKCKQYIMKWDAVGSILKQTKRKHQLTIKTCIKYVDKKSPLGDSIRFVIFVVYQFHPGT
jgi:hypothetical protein